MTNQTFFSGVVFRLSDAQGSMVKASGLQSRGSEFHSRSGLCVASLSKIFYFLLFQSTHLQELVERSLVLLATSVMLSGEADMHGRLLVFHNQSCTDLCLRGYLPRCNARVIHDRRESLPILRITFSNMTCLLGIQEKQATNIFSSYFQQIEQSPKDFSLASCDKCRSDFYWFDMSNLSFEVFLFNTFLLVSII